MLTVSSLYWLIPTAHFSKFKLSKYSFTSLLGVNASSFCSSIHAVSGMNELRYFSFNETADQYVIKPIAEGYKFILPEFVRTGVTNFFSNINDVLIAANNLLQGKPGNAASDIGRFFVNSTIGVLGLFDVATDMGLDKNREDFGQTLGVWGIGDGPYVVLPFFGPSNVRDTVGFVVDVETDFMINTNKLNSDEKIAINGLRIINRRADLLDAGQLLEDAAFDKYSFLRDGYLQRRRSQIYDGEPPPLKEE